MEDELPASVFHTATGKAKQLTAEALRKALKYRVNVEPFEGSVVFYGGQHLCGEIEFEWHRPEDYCVVPEMTLDVVVTESSHWHVEAEEETKGYRKSVLTSFAVFGKDGGTVRYPGRSMPFKIQLPAALTPTTIEFGPGEHASRVSITAELQLRYGDVYTEPGGQYQPATTFRTVPMQLVASVPPQVFRKGAVETTLTLNPTLSQGSVTVTARAPSYVWMPGRAVPVSITVQNHTNRDLTGFSTRLVQRPQLFSTGREASIEQDRYLLEERNDEAIPKGAAVQTDVVVIVPNRTTSSTHPADSLFEVKYEFHVCVHIPKSRERWLEMPVIVANPRHIPPATVDLTAALDAKTRSRSVSVSGPRAQVTVIGASGLRQTDFFSKIDPYTVVSSIGTVGAGKSSAIAKTTVKKRGGRSPKWDETLPVDVGTSSSASLVFTVFEWDRFSKDDTLGWASISVADLIRRGSNEEITLTLQHSTHSKCGEIRFSVVLPPEILLDYKKQAAKAKK